MILPVGVSVRRAERQEVREPVADTEEIKEEEDRPQVEAQSTRNLDKSKVPASKSNKRQ